VPEDEELLEDELLLDDELLLEDELLVGLVLPVELLELEELDGEVSLGFFDPPLPQATKAVVKNANNKDLASVFLKFAISPPGLKIGLVLL
jgi:hypothetical protein